MSLETAEMSKPWCSPTPGQYQTGANDKAARFDRGLRTYQKHIGVTPEEMTIHLFMEALHPEDKSYFLCFENTVVKFVNLVPKNKVRSSLNVSSKRSLVLGIFCGFRIPNFISKFIKSLLYEKDNASICISNDVCFWL